MVFAHRVFKISDIFKAYDIRGLYPSELNEELIEKIAKAFVLKTKAKKIAVGADQRPHSPSLLKALLKGLTEMGVEVIDFGLSTTSMFYFAVAHLKADAGMMVTASHNPSQYNGLKMTWHEAIPFGDQDIQDLKKLVEENQFPKTKTLGQIVKQNIFPDYQKKILSFAQIKHPLKIVTDTGNGMSALDLPILQSLPLAITSLYPEIDLSFPNHESNPLKFETLKDLQKAVLQQKANLGLAFDGDGDRAGFVDEKGNIIPVDLITALLADFMPGQPIIYDVRSSKIVKETVEKNRGQAVPSRVGHYFIKKLMREKNIAFAGEVSGHYYFKEMSYADCAILAAVKVLNILSQTNQPFSALIKKYLKYSKINETNFEVKDKAKKLKEIEERYKYGKLSYLDGLTAEFPDWWFNLRESNTEPLLRLNLEANTPELMQEKTEELVKHLNDNKNNKI